MQVGQKLLLAFVPDTKDAQRLREAFRPPQFQSVFARDIQGVARLLASAQFDLAIVNWEPQDSENLNVCLHLKSRGGPPVFIFSAIDHKHDLPEGADMLLSKSLSPRKLLGRVTGHLQATSNPTSRLHFGNFQLDMTTYEAFWKFREIKIPRIEFQMLLLFLKHQDLVLSRDFIFNAIWPKGGYALGRLVDVHVSNLRKALVRDARLAPIRTLRGTGYCFSLSKRRFMPRSKRRREP